MLIVYRDKLGEVISSIGSTSIGERDKLTQSSSVGQGKIVYKHIFIIVHENYSVNTYEYLTYLLKSELIRSLCEQK